MKKIGRLLIVITIIIIGTIFVLKQFSNKTTYFYLASNENAYFDVRLHSAVIPNYGQAMPFDNGSMVDNELIKNIVPYYPLRIGEKDESTPIDITFKTDENTQVRTLPIPVTNTKQLNHVNLSAYLDEDFFIKDMDIIKTFNSDSGIYITEFLVKTLDLDIKGNTLTVESSVLLPYATSKKMETMSEKSNDGKLIVTEFESYYPTHFSTTDFLIEVEGIISYTDFSSDQDIYIPYRLSEQLYQQVKVGEIKENHLLWQPTIYMIECNGNVDIDELGNELLNQLDSFVLYEIGYEACAPTNSKIFKK